jgi:hypothetical protein
LSSFFTPLLAKGEATIWSLFITHPIKDIYCVLERNQFNIPYSICLWKLNKTSQNCNSEEYHLED